MKLNNFLTRTLTGTVYVTLIVASILIHPLFFYIVFAGFAIAGLIEFYNITNSDKIKPHFFTGMFITVVMFVFSANSAFNAISLEYLLILVPLSFSVFIFELFRNKQNPLQNIATTLLGLFYIALPLSLLVFIPNISLENGVFKKGLLLGFFILIWTNDTFAYLIGVKFGKNKLFERVSPKKSWEGSFGGFLFSIIVAYILSLFFIDLNTMEWIGMAIIIVVFGSIGDLIESLFKRSLNIKDSGNILPGHGGILDRLDAVLIAAPFVFFYLLLINFLI
jgi:phosphatidate cytidylyltransferase